MTITPRFILAGSRAQLDIPINATLFSLAMTCKRIEQKHRMRAREREREGGREGGREGESPLLLGCHQLLQCHPPAEGVKPSEVGLGSPQPAPLHLAPPQ